MFEVEVGHCVDPMKWNSGAMLMTAPNKEFALAGSLEELKAKGRLVVHGRHRPILLSAFETFNMA